MKEVSVCVRQNGQHIHLFHRVLKDSHKTVLVLTLLHRYDLQPHSGSLVWCCRPVSPETVFVSTPAGAAIEHCYAFLFLLFSPLYMHFPSLVSSYYDVVYMDRSLPTGLQRVEQKLVHRRDLPAIEHKLISNQHVSGGFARNIYNCKDVIWLKRSTNTL